MLFDDSITKNLIDFLAVENVLLLSDYTIEITFECNENEVIKQYIPRLHYKQLEIGEITK